MEVTFAGAKSAASRKRLKNPLDRRITLQLVHSTRVPCRGEERCGLHTEARGRYHVSSKGIVCALLLLVSVSACEPLRSARDDLTRLVSSPSPPQNRGLKSPSTPSVPPATASRDPDKTGGKNSELASPEVGAAEPVNLIGKSEGDLRALLGPPTSEEENAPGKTWRYRDGQCALSVRLYPDINTRQFATLGYEVKRDDNTDEGKRACLAAFGSRAQAKRGR
jgi:hypothetical protein